MKITLQKIVFFLIVFFGAQVVIFSQVIENPPPPTAPGPPGMPIDGGTVVLFCLALFLGYVFSKKYILIKKGS